MYRYGQYSIYVSHPPSYSRRGKPAEARHGCTADVAHEPDHELEWEVSLHSSALAELSILIFTYGATETTKDSSLSAARAVTSQHPAVGKLRPVA